MGRATTTRTRTVLHVSQGADWDSSVRWTSKREQKKTIEWMHTQSKLPSAGVEEPYCVPPIRFQVIMCGMYS